MTTMKTRQRLRHRVCVIGNAALILCATALLHTGCAQAQQPQMPGVNQPPSSAFPQPHSMLPGSEQPADPMSAHLEAERLRLQKNDRYQHLQSDADKLLALATAMKAEIDSMGKDEVSLDVLRKTDQIDKLTHDIRDRMKN